MDQGVTVNDRRGKEEEAPKEQPTIANESTMPKPKYVVEIGVLDEHMTVSVKAPVPLHVVERALQAALAFVERDLMAQHLIGTLNRATARVQPVHTMPAGVMPRGMNPYTGQPGPR